METWGELFWDAWIRFRLWCRSLRRMYWPPRIEAWQVCTVTGVAAIVMTILSLRSPDSATALAGQTVDKTKSTTAQIPAPTAKSSHKPKKQAALPAVDPYQEAQSIDGAIAVDEEIVLEGTKTPTSDSETPSDPEFADIGPSRPPRTDLRQAARPGKSDAALDVADTETADDLNMHADADKPKANLDEPASESTDSSHSVPEPNEFDIPVRKKPDVKSAAGPSHTHTKDPAADPQAFDSEKVDLAESTLPTPPESAGDFEPKVAKPRPETVKVLPDRDPDHYSRPHHEEYEPERTDAPVARRKQIAITAPQPAPKSTVRNKGHYSSFGDDEDAHAESNTGNTFEAKRTNTVPPAPADADQPDVTPPPASELPKAEADAFEEPIAPPARKQRQAEPTEEPTSRELPLPPSEVDVMPELEREPDEDVWPPILIAPESNEPQDSNITDPTSRTIGEPAIPTESENHEAHAEDDTVVGRKHKMRVQLAPSDEQAEMPPVDDEADAVPPVPQKSAQSPSFPAESDVPAEDAPPKRRAKPAHDEEDAPGRDGDHRNTEEDPPRVPPKKEFHGPVLSTDSVDHEEHSNEDVFSGGKRKNRGIPALPPSKPAEHHGPVLSTDPADHQAHLNDDSISSGSSNHHWPKAKTIKPTQEHQARQPVATEVPVTEKSGTPEVTKQYEPADEISTVVIPKGTVAPMKSEHVDQATAPNVSSRTEPRTNRRTTPQVIENYEVEVATPPATQSIAPNEAASEPMPELTQPRGPSRIAIPQRIPQPEDTPPKPRTRPSAAIPAAPPSVHPAPRLEMEITGPRQAPVGTQIVLHFKIKNAGNAPATGIMVSDVLPPGMHHRLSPDLEYSIPRLAPGETRETNLTVQCTAPGVVTNRAVLTADGDITTEAAVQIEVTTASGANVPAAGTAGARSPLTVSHRGPERWLVDSTGQFLVTVTNVSGQHLKDVTITETYPANTNLLHATVGHKADAQNRTVSWTISDFAPGQAYILETELHSVRSGPQTTTVKVKVGGTDVAEDRWTAVSFSE